MGVKYVPFLSSCGWFFFWLLIVLCHVRCWISSKNKYVREYSGSRSFCGGLMTVRLSFVNTFDPFLKFFYFAHAVSFEPTLDGSWRIEIWCSSSGSLLYACSFFTFLFDVIMLELYKLLKHEMSLPDWFSHFCHIVYLLRSVEKFCW